MTNFEKHEVNWTPQKISNFWDYISSNPHFSEIYFTKHSGKAIVKDFLSVNTVTDKSILDFGCGPGNLFNALDALCSGFKYTGMDFSRNSIEYLKETHKENLHFSDAIHIDSFPVNHKNTYDYIICCEVIEHLDDETLAAVTSTFFNLLSPGGVLYITTPNNENLDASKSMCPDCGAIYHLWQHMRSWSCISIKRHFEKHGFKTIKTKTLHFDNSWIMSRLKLMIKTWIFKIPPRNLVHICQKTRT